MHLLPDRVQTRKSYVPGLCFSTTGPTLTPATHQPPSFIARTINRWDPNREVSRSKKQSTQRKKRLCKINQHVRAVMPSYSENNNIWQFKFRNWILLHFLPSLPLPHQPLCAAMHDGFWTPANTAILHILSTPAKFNVATKNEVSSSSHHPSPRRQRLRL